MMYKEFAYCGMQTVHVFNRDIQVQQYICVFCGKTTNCNTAPCECFLATQYHLLDRRLVFNFIESNRNVFVEKTGKKTFHIFSNKKDHDAFLNEKLRRKEENAVLQKKLQEEREARDREWRLRQEAEEKERIRLEGLRCLKRDTALKNLTFKEMIDELIDIANRYRNQGYDECVNDSFKEEGIITFEELSSYIQTNYESLIDAEVEERERQAAMDE